MRSTLLLPAAVLAAAAAAAGCSRARAGEPIPQFVDPPPATAQVPERPRYRVPPAEIPVPDATDGVYVLTSVGGASLPAPVGGPGQCTPRVVSGTLSLAEDRFSLSQPVQEDCPGRTGTTVRRADGRFEISVSTLRLTADPGGSFTGATGVVMRGGEVQLVEVTAPTEGSRPVDWRFRRETAETRRQ